jgi:hypothetical protein
VKADLPASARPILDDTERRQVLSRILRSVGRDSSELDDWVENSPLVAVQLADT